VSRETSASTSSTESGCRSWPNAWRWGYYFPEVGTSEAFHVGDAGMVEEEVRGLNEMVGRLRGE
jgi:hypothetical protein